MKKLVALVLALVMVFAMAVPAFAEEDPRKLIELVLSYLPE